MKKNFGNILGLSEGSATSRQRQDLVAASLGMVTTQALGACVKLELCDILNDGAMTLDKLASLAKVQKKPLYELITILKSLDVVDMVATEVMLGPAGKLLLASHPDSIALWIRYAAEFCSPAWQELVDVVRGKPPGADSKRHIYNALKNNSYPAAIFHGAMQDTQLEVISELVESMRIFSDELVVDFGAGQSTFLVELLNRYPTISGVAVDCFSDFTKVKRYAEIKGVQQRLKTLKSDLLAPLPMSPDVIVFKNVLADWDDHNVMLMLANAHNSLQENGRLYIATTHCHKQPTPEDAVVSLNLRVLTEGGDRTVVEYIDLAEQAGFVFVKRSNVAAVAIIEFECQSVELTKVGIDE